MGRKKKKDNAEKKQGRTGNEHPDTTTAEDTAETTPEADTPQNTADKTASEDTVPAGTYNELNEKYIRLLAEYDNYRKRTAREMKGIMESGIAQVMREMLPVLDNLDRATEHRNNATTMEEYVKGVALIEDQLRQVLAHAGLEKMEVVGTEFDPNEHDAVMQMESDEYDPGIISAEVEKGYKLNGKVIRHPKVVVSK